MRSKRGQIEAVHEQQGLGRVQIGLAQPERDFPLLSRKDRNVVVLPEDRKNLFLLFSFYQAQAGEERNALAGIFELNAKRGIALSPCGGMQGGLEGGFRQ